MLLNQYLRRFDFNKPEIIRLKLSTARPEQFIHNTFLPTKKLFFCESNRRCYKCEMTRKSSLGGSRHIRISFLLLYFKISLKLYSIMPFIQNEKHLQRFTLNISLSISNENTKNSFAFPSSQECKYSSTLYLPCKNCCCATHQPLSH